MYSKIGSIKSEIPNRNFCLNFCYVHLVAETSSFKEGFFKIMYYERHFRQATTILVVQLRIEFIYLRKCRLRHLKITFKSTIKWNWRPNFSMPALTHYYYDFSFQVFNSLTNLRGHLYWFLLIHVFHAYVLHSPCDRFRKRIVRSQFCITVILAGCSIWKRTFQSVHFQLKAECYYLKKYIVGHRTWNYTYLPQKGTLWHFQ